MRKKSFLYFILVFCVGASSLFGQSKDAYVFYLDNIGMQKHSLSPRVYLHQQNKPEPSDKGNDKLIIKPSSIDRIFAKNYLNILDKNYFEQFAVYKNHLLLGHKSGVMVMENTGNISEFNFESGSYDDFKSKMLIHISENKDNYEKTIKAIQGKDANANFRIDRESEALENLFFNTGAESIYIVGFYIPDMDGRLDIYEKISGDEVAYSLQSSIGVSVRTVMYKYENNTFSLAGEYRSTPQPITANSSDSNAQTSTSLTPQRMKNEIYKGFAKSLKNALAQIKTSLRAYSAFSTQGGGDQLTQNAFESEETHKRDFIQGDRAIVSPLDGTADDIFASSSNIPVSMDASFVEGDSVSSEPEAMPISDIDFMQNGTSEGVMGSASAWTINNVDGKKFQAQLDELSKEKLKIDQLLLTPSGGIAKVGAIGESVHAKMIRGSINKDDTVQLFPYSGNIFGFYYANSNLGYQYGSGDKLLDTNLTYHNLGFSYSSNFGYSLNSPFLSHFYLSTYIDIGMSKNANHFVSLNTLFEPISVFEATYKPTAESNLFNFGLGIERRFYTGYASFIALGVDGGVEVATMNYNSSFPVSTYQSYLINTLTSPKITAGMLLGKQWEIHANASYDIPMFNYNFYTNGVQKSLADIYKDGRQNGFEFMFSISKNLNP